MAKTRRSYTLEFKQEAVRLVREQGLMITEVAPELGVDKSVVGTWVRKADAGELGGKPTAPSAPAPALLDDVRRLRKENKVLREEREILKKAALDSRGRR
ncbi:MAG: transposase [Myxococcota bacterium]|jgi:transposase